MVESSLCALLSLLSLSVVDVVILCFVCLSVVQRSEIEFAKIFLHEPVEASFLSFVHPIKIAKTHDSKNDSELIVRFTLDAPPRSWQRPWGPSAEGPRP